MTGRRPGSRRRLLVLAVIAAVVVAFLAGGGVTWWALGEENTDVRDHVEVSGGELVADDSDDAYCDDDDIYSYNDCDTDPDETYEFSYRVTNKGDGPANYSVVVNAFDEEGDFVGQTYVGTTHLAAGETDSDKGEFNEYSDFEGKRELSDITSVKVAHAERIALAN
ncbi:FxLYD domain-containing protein [Streptomyces hirsutus]|uniref:FxLYD domain-containing protein n=2 Tax=Streptomyces hirsutus TaxID=35620 RepID=UPI00369A0DD0